ncbi:thioesterase family protein [Luteipulveratus halotolerans]|uniref:TesB-like acyl-CoA thioesterase 3 n=1 Tax=Luteipulveratus halotolerans TaxID=1631356 RepID=A0A0L6CME3_9MICO|nr:thioesterase family protein [Luteipulveratus halotolerans]KNX38917.1 TesB-like acyl-CoA thioesterase 3 [Luteipulveratus halotolerans]
MSEFDDAIAFTPADAPGSYDVRLDRAWTIGGGINGGLLLSVISNALSDALGAGGHPDPMSISAYYLAPGRPGPATVETSIVRKGGSVSVASATLVQQGADGERVESIKVLATFTDLDKAAGETDVRLTPPNLPPLEKCIRASDAPPEVLKEADLLQRSDLRLDPATAMWAVGKPSGNGRIQGWWRLVDGREPDVLALPFVCDVLPPVSMDLGKLGWAPTLEFTVHVLAKPAPGWLRVVHFTEHVAAGHFVEDCQVWDSEDTLVAQSRQLARLPRPPR